MPAPVQRPFFESTDLAYLGWMIMGPILVAVIPESRYAGAARLLARLSRKGQTKAGAAAITIGGIPEEQSATAIGDLFAGRYQAYLRLFRGLIFRKHMRVAVRGLDHLTAALAAQRGVILWIADFIEAPTATKIGFAQAGYPLSHLSRPEHGFSKSRFGIAVLNPVRTKYEDQFLRERIMFDRNAPHAARDAILRRLEENGVVSVMASAHEGRYLADVRFLRGRLRLATGPLRFAAIAGCPVLPVFTLPGPREGSHEVVVEPPLRRPEDNHEPAALAASVADFTSRLERYVRNHPAAWAGWRRSNLLAAASDGRT